MKYLSELVEDIRFNHDISFVSRIMNIYNLSDDKAEELLNPLVKAIEHPALDEMLSFIKNAKKLFIGGDYDCDGVTSTAIAVEVAKALGVEDTGFYIPNRIKEGYGISFSTIKMAYEKGYTDILLVDNGVKALEEIRYAKSLGMRVAVVDHHIFEEPLDVDAFIHPNLFDVYGNEMCAAGLMTVIAEHAHVLSPRILAYGAVGTIGDIVPLWGKNRELVLRGIEVMNQEGIMALDSLSKRTRYTTYNATTIAFQIVPKINAVGRMADLVNMNTMVEYLLSDDDAVVSSYSKQVLSLNDYRKKLGKELKHAAMAKVNGDAVQIIEDRVFHEGLSGIVANQVVQELGRPAIILTEYDSVLKGSARSNTISLKALFDQLPSHYFEAYGGHDFAFGMTVKKLYFDDFKHDVLKHASTLPKTTSSDPSIYVDEVITRDEIEALLKYEPFGTDFEFPRFMVALPESFDVFAINGYGYKLTFHDFFIKEAVFFNTRYRIEDVKAMRVMVGKFELKNKTALSFNIDTMQSMI